MKFIVQWKGLPTAQQSAIERFMKTGGALPPDGITMLGRWHAIGELSGCAIIEADSTAPIAAWVLQFGDIFTFTVSPAVTDEELGRRWGRFRRGSKAGGTGALIRVPMRFCFSVPGPPLPGMRW